MFCVEYVQACVGDLHPSNGLQLGFGHRGGDLILDGGEFLGSGGRVAAQTEDCLPERN